MFDCHQLALLCSLIQFDHPPLIVSKRIHSLIHRTNELAYNLVFEFNEKIIMLEFETNKLNGPGVVMWNNFSHFYCYYLFSSNRLVNQLNFLFRLEKKTTQQQLKKLEFRVVQNKQTESNNKSPISFFLFFQILTSGSQSLLIDELIAP